MKVKIHKFLVLIPEIFVINFILFIVLIKTKILCVVEGVKKNKIKNDEDEICIKIHDKLTESPCNKCNKKKI